MTVRAHPQAGVTTGAPTRNGWIPVICLLVVALVVVVYAAHPHGAGRTLFDATGFVLLIVLAYGPLHHRARPLGLWLCFATGVVFLLLESVARATTLRVGDLGLGEVFSLCAYLALSGWLGYLTWHVGRGGVAQLLLDSSAAATGTFLALWTLTGLSGRIIETSAIVWVLFPVVDVLALALAMHLAFRLDEPVPAWRWLIAAIIVQLLLDAADFAISLGSTQIRAHTSHGLYLFTYACLALGASHPSVPAISRPGSGLAPPRSRVVRPAMIVLAVVPAVAALAVPVHTPVDGLVRSLLVCVLLLLLFARLLTTMSALTRAEADSRRRALHDPLTGLLNRGGLFDALTLRLERDAAARRATAVLFIDCDNFKQVNDTWGHPAGDVLLQGIATGLPSHLRDDDIVARHGGDEFVVVATVDDEAEAEAVAAHVARFFTSPLPVLPGREHLMTPSVGVAVTAPGETPTAVELIERADAAVYEAKARGRARYVMFDRVLEARARRRSAISVALRGAIARDELTVAFQPLLGGENYDSLVGWEALARWVHPDLGAVPPDVFIPVAEEMGLIDDLGEAVLRRACRDLARMRKALGTDTPIVSVNVSAPQLTQPSFAPMVTEALAEAGLTGDALWLEVTETLLVDTGPAVLDTIARLRESGVLICLDDFGTGVSSFATLLDLPVGCVKIDKSLVRTMAEDPDAVAQVGALVRLFGTLHIGHVVAEGVETTAHEAALKSVGCPMVQGWFYGKAASADDIIAAHGGLERLA